MFALQPGSRLDHYQVLAPLGAGGMGEVYRARDTKLGRDVALKFVRGEFAADPDRVSRLEREARALASLSHPHIAQIYGLEEFGGKPYLVLELIEGDSLDQLLKGGAPPLEQALKYAGQIAEALEAAHTSGILHRDLKPANIKLTASGEVKVLDFGLGKMFEDVQTSGSESPTRSALTAAEILMGTPPYMSPEQVRGKSADRRSDIWAFGCVLYELLAGKAAFAGDSTADILGAITKVEPDWPALPASVPPLIQRLVRRCLQKDPLQRLQHIGDARIEIEEELRGPAADAPVLAPLPARRPVSLWLGLGVGLLGGALLVTGLSYFRDPPAALPRMHLEVSRPEPTKRGNSWAAISPDGRSIVFEQSYQGRPALWIRPMDSDKAVPLDKSDSASFPFWSADSLSLAFFAEGKLKRVAVAGGPAQVIAEAPNPRGGAWSSLGTILFNAASSGPLSRVSVDGSGLGAATELQKDQGSHRYPQFLPDGRRFLYFALGKPEVTGIYAGSLDSPESTRILASESQAVYVHPGYLLFLRKGVLLAQPFDLENLKLTGDPLPLAENVATGFTGWVFVSAADNGTIAYLVGGKADASLTWIDRQGNPAGTLGPVGSWSTVDLSPDETRVLSAKVDEGNGDIWLIEVARGVATRMTTDPAEDEDPRWDPEGLRFSFDSNRKGAFDIYEMSLSNPGKETLLVESSQTKIAHGWSSDGRYLLFGATDEKTSGNLWALPFFGAREPIPVVVRDYTQLFGSLSPDQHWVAYESNETGRPEIYVQSFPDGRDKQQLSLDGGQDPRWGRNGKEVFFVSSVGAMMAVGVSAVPGNGRLQAATPMALFPGVSVRPHGFAVSRDGQRFLMPIAVDHSSPPIAILINWAPESRAR